MSTSRPNEHLVTSLTTCNIPMGFQKDFPNKHEEDHFVTIETESKAVKMASVSIHGGNFWRKNNEDYMNVDFLPGFEKLAPEVQKLVLQSWVNEVQKQFKEKNLGSGCTGCVTITWVDEEKNVHVLTANLGDSHADAYVMKTSDDKKQHELEKASRLMKIHKPGDKDEEKRIESEFGRVSDGRINGNLNISRAFGDVHLKPLIDDTLEIEEFISPLESGKQILLFNSCDGMDEIMDEVNFQKILLENVSIDRLAVNLINLLVRETNRDERDNTSFIITILDAPKPEDKPTRPVFSAVYDGHSGKECAKFVSEVGLPILKEKIQFALTPEGIASLRQEEKERQAAITLRQQKKAHLKDVVERLRPLAPVPDNRKKDERKGVYYNHAGEGSCEFHFYYGKENEETVKGILEKKEYASIKNITASYDGGFIITFDLKAEGIPPKMIDCFHEMNKECLNEKISLQNEELKHILGKLKQLPDGKNSYLSLEKADPDLVFQSKEEAKAFINALGNDELIMSCPPCKPLLPYPKEGRSVVFLTQEVKHKLEENKVNVTQLVRDHNGRFQASQSCFLKCKNKQVAEEFLADEKFKYISHSETMQGDEKAQQAAQGYGKAPQAAEKEKSSLFSWPETRYKIYFTGKEVRELNDILDKKPVPEKSCIIM